MSSICFIGAGNMAQSIIGGLIQSGTASNTIWATARSSDNRDVIRNRFQNIHVTEDNLEAVQACRIIVLAVKPQMMSGVCEQLAPFVKDKLIISVAAGITCSTLENWLGNEVAIVRCMPNTPALVQEGASGLYANNNTSTLQRQASEAILSATGNVCWVEDEEQMHAVTAVSGSGPAYFFLFMEAMVAAAEKQGLPTQVAQSLAMQTAKGAALLAQDSDDDLATLRKKVTSPGGTTEQALLSFEQHKLRYLVEEAMSACANRSKELAEELS